MALARIIGIDFGTTNTRIQLGYTQAPERTSPLEPPNAERDALPSVILVDESGEVLQELGKPAVRALTDPARRDRVRLEFKPCLGRDERDLGKQTETLVLELRCPSCGAKIPEGFLFCGKCGDRLPEDYQQTLAERALRYQRQEAFAYARLLLSEVGRFVRRTTLGDSGWDVGDRIVVGVPVHWSEETRREYASLVAEALGTNQVEPVDEPRAALAEYLWRAGDEVRAGQTVLVVDVGGGTTDLVAGTVQENGTLGGDLRSHGIRYGGSDFDDRVVLWAMRQVERPDGLQEDQLAGALRPVCRGLKEELSDAIRRDPDRANPQAEMPFSSRELYADLALDRATFESEEVAGPLISVFGEALAKGLAEMGLRADDVAHVILVGGGSNAYFVEDVAKRAFPAAKIVAGQQPEVAIAKGLVLVTAASPLPAAAQPTSEQRDKGGAFTSERDMLDIELDKDGDRFQEAVRCVRRCIDAGKSKQQIERRFNRAGWAAETFEVVWARAVEARPPDAEDGPCPPRSASTQIGGLWGPAEAFPEVVESLEAGRWDEARKRAEALYSRTPDSPASTLMLLYVRLLADVAGRVYKANEGGELLELGEEAVSRSPRSGMARYLRALTLLIVAREEMKWIYVTPDPAQNANLRRAIEDAEVAQNIDAESAGAEYISALAGDERSGKALSNGVGGFASPPASMLGHLLRAVALQVWDPRCCPGIDMEEWNGLFANTVASRSVDDDPGLAVLEPWRGTPLEVQLLWWLSGFWAPGPVRPIGLARCLMSLGQILERSEEPRDLLGLAEVGRAVDELLLSEWTERGGVELGEAVRVLTGNAAMVAWCYVRDADPDAILLVSPFLRVEEAVTETESRLTSNYKFVKESKIRLKTGRYTLVRCTRSQRGCVITDEVLHKEYDSLFLRDGFALDGSFIPFAWVGSISISEGMIWNGVTVRAADGSEYLRDATFSKGNSYLLRRLFLEWRNEWGDIADGKRAPQRRARFLTDNT